MAFRDDREALHAQVDSLRRELEDERAARTKDAEQAKDRLEQEREKRRKLERGEGKRPRPALVAAVIVALVVLAGGVGYLTMFTSTSGTATSPAEPARASSPDAAVKPRDPVEEVLVLARDSTYNNASEQVSLLAAAAVARASEGQREPALRLLAEAEKMLGGSDWDQASRAQSLGLVACGLADAGATERAGKMVQRVKEMVVKLYSDESEVETYSVITKTCIDQGVRTAAVRPFVDLFIAASDKHRDEEDNDSDGNLVKICEWLASLLDVEGLNALIAQKLSRPLRSYTPGLLAQVAEQLWRAGNQKRAAELLDAVKLKDKADGFVLADVAQALAVAGRKEQALPLAEQALEALRKETGYMQTQLRTQIATVFARLGQLARARQIHDNEETEGEILVGADLLDQSLERERKNAGVYTSWSLARKLARAGRAEQAYAVARKLPNRTMAMQSLAAAYTIVHRGGH